MTAKSNEGYCLYTFFMQTNYFRYPLGLCLLAEFENSDELYQQAVDSCEMYYDGSHVFPYCFQGQFYSKNGKYKEAISCWSKAAHVLTRCDKMCLISTRFLFCFIEIVLMCPDVLYAPGITTHGKTKKFIEKLWI